MALRLRWLIGFYLISNLMFLNHGAADNLKNNPPKFKKQNIELVQNNNKKTISVELAETVEQQSYGLMFRQKLKNNEGMLFIFKDEKTHSFWMKNTLINLDIGYFDKNKKLIDIQQMTAVSSVMQTDIPVYPSKQPAMYALEMTQGWYKKNKFTLGAKFKISN